MENLTNIFQNLRISNNDARNAILDLDQALTDRENAQEGNAEGNADAAIPEMRVPLEPPFVDLPNGTFAQIGSDVVLNLRQTQTTMTLGYNQRYYSECKEGTRRLINLVLLRGLTQEVASTFVFVYGQVVWDYLSTLSNYLQEGIEIEDLGLQHLQNEDLFWTAFIHARVEIDPLCQLDSYYSAYIDAIFPDPQQKKEYCSIQKFNYYQKTAQTVLPVSTKVELDNLVKGDQATLHKLKINTMSKEESDMARKTSRFVVEYSRAACSSPVGFFNTVCQQLNMLMKGELKIKVQKNLTYLKFGQYLKKCYSDKNKEKDYKATLENPANEQQVDRVFRGAHRITAFEHVFGDDALRCLYLFDNTLICDVSDAVFDEYLKKFEAHKDLLVNAMNL